jgi:hypothetical protein
LYRDVPQEELDLLQFAAGSAAEPSAGPAQVVRGEFALTSSPQGLPAPLTQRKPFPVSMCAAIIHFVQLVVDPIRHGNRSDVTALTAQIHYCLVSFALLQAVNGQLGRLVTPQPTSEQEGEQRTITFSL